MIISILHGFCLVDIFSLALKELLISWLKDLLISLFLYSNVDFKYVIPTLTISSFLIMVTPSYKYFETSSIYYVNILSLITVYHVHMALILLAYSIPYYFLFRNSFSTSLL